MSKLRPQLIVTGSNKRKGGFASGVGYFIVLILVFVLGVYVGMRVESTDIDAENYDASSQNLSAPENQREQQASVEVIEDSSDNTDINSIQAESKSEYSNNINQKLTSISDNESPKNEETPSFDQEGLTVTDTRSEDEGGSVGQLNLASNISLEGAKTEDDSFRLQVAAFANSDRANAVAEQLREKGYGAYIVTSSNSRGEVWNLIKVGNFQTVEQAMEVSTVFQRNEGGEVFIESLTHGRVDKNYLDNKKEEPQNSNNIP